MFLFRTLVFLLTGPIYLPHKFLRYPIINGRIPFLFSPPLLPFAAHMIAEHPLLLKFCELSLGLLLRTALYLRYLFDQRKPVLVWIIPDAQRHQCSGSSFKAHIPEADRALRFFRRKVVVAFCLFYNADIPAAEVQRIAVEVFEQPRRFPIKEIFHRRFPSVGASDNHLSADGDDDFPHFHQLGQILLGDKQTVYPV